MKLPQAWIRNKQHKQPKEEIEMKIDLNESTSTALVVAFLCAAVYGLATQIVACNTSRAVSEKSCMAAGGSPYKCCKEFAFTDAACDHLAK